MIYQPRSWPRRVAARLAAAPYNWRSSDLARMFGVSRQRVLQWLGKRNRQIPKGQGRMMARIIRRLNVEPFRFSLALIAEIWGVKEHTISNVLRIGR